MKMESIVCKVSKLFYGTLGGHWLVTGNVTGNVTLGVFSLTTIYNSKVVRRVKDRFIIYY